MSKTKLYTKDKNDTLEILRTKAKNLQDDIDKRGFLTNVFAFLFLAMNLGLGMPDALTINLARYDQSVTAKLHVKTWVYTFLFLCIAAPISLSSLAYL